MSTHFVFVINQPNVGNKIPYLFNTVCLVVLESYYQQVWGVHKNVRKNIRFSNVNARTSGVITVITNQLDMDYLRHLFRRLHPPH